MPDHMITFVTMLCLIATLAWISGAPIEHVLIMYGAAVLVVVCFFEGKGYKGER